ncbi:MAG: hypothetical protein AB7N80_01170 [Bdellovibrionales bacterium]
MAKVFTIIKERYTAQLAGLSLPLKIGVLGVIGQLSFGLIYDGWPDTGKTALAILFSIGMLVLCIEAAALFEFRGVQLMDYSSSKSSPERDGLIGRIAIRVLLCIGNIALAISLYKDVWSK